MHTYTTEEKAAAFDRIAAHYYNRNFGSLPKPNLDVLMFSVYLEHCLQNNESTDDYTLSKELGISQTKVRSLKQSEMLQLTSSRAENWKTEFVNCSKYARYDPAKQLVKMTIPEVVVLNELRHFIVSHGLYDEYQLNPRLFQCRIDVFAEICSLLENNGILFDDDSRKKIKEIKEKLESEDGKSAIEKICSGDWKNGLLDLSRVVGKEILAEVLDQIPFYGIAKTAIQSLCKAIKNS